MPRLMAFIASGRFITTWATLCVTVKRTGGCKLITSSSFVCSGWQVHLPACLPVGPDDSLSFLFAAWQGPIGNQFRLGPEVELLAQQLSDLLRQVSHLLGCQILRQFHTQPEVLVWGRMVDKQLELAGKLLGEVRQRIGHRSGKDIDTTDVKHVITASQDAETKTGSSASTGTSSQDTYNIAGTIAHQGLGLLEQVGVDQFTLDSLNKWKRRPCFGFDQLDEHRPLRLEVQSLAVRAFRAHNTEHICHAKIGIHGAHTPGFFHSSPYPLFTDAWFGPKEALTQAQIARVDPLSQCRLG